METGCKNVCVTLYFIILQSYKKEADTSMGLLGRLKGLFRKKNEFSEDEYNPEWENASLRREDVDFHDQTQRENYITACLEQISEASNELDTLGGEYELVTSYLKDMEEIEAFPEETMEKVKKYAKAIVEIEGSRERLRKKRMIMSEEEYTHMERIEQYMPEGYDRLKKAEEYQVLVKKDLGRLDGERHAYNFRRNELINSQQNMKGITTICVASMVFLAMLLAVLGAALKLDVELGYVIAILISAFAITLMYVKYHDSQRELIRVEKTINKLVLLQNTVKIRYVNNTNLLEYLYVKYDVNSSAELNKLWDKYLQENKAREQEQQMEQDMEINQSSLIKLLRRHEIHDPAIWIHQAQALIDSKEMVEIRHNLILRRQKLRKQMEYNAQAAQEAQDEVKDIVAQYPEYAKSIVNIVSEYEKAMA